MKLMRIQAVVRAALIWASPALAADTAVGAGTAFCETRLNSDDAALRGLFSPSLLAIVKEAERRNDIIAKATPDEKPPFGDGVPYQSFQDHAPVCKVGRVEETSSSIDVEIHHSFPDTPNADWTDRLVLLPRAEGYLIDDILFANVANGNVDQGLRRVLFEAFDQ